MRLPEAEANLRALLLSREARPFAGAPEDRQRLYRRLVRGNLVQAVLRAVPIARRVLGDGAMEPWIAAWLEDSPPTTGLLLEVPSAFAGWLGRQADPPHAAFPELVHWETLELEVLHAPDGGAGETVDPSARLVSYRHPVHRMNENSRSWPEPAPSPVLLLAHRADERRRVLELTPLAAQLLALVGAGASPEEAVDRLDAVHGGVDRAAARRAIGDLRARGVLR